MGWRANKFKNKPVRDGSLYFASQDEHHRYQELKLLEKAGEITDLELQPKWELLPKFTDFNGGKHQAITYKADFMYTDKDGIVIVEDVKSPPTMTQTYKIKKKLLLFRYDDFVFREV